MSDQQTIASLPEMHTDSALHAKHSILGLVSTLGAFGFSFTDVERWLRITSLIIGIVIGLITLKRMFFPKPQKRRRDASGFLILLVAGLAILGAGCTSHYAERTKAQGKLDATKAGIAEESRALNTGVVDSLGMAPTNKPTALALKLARKNEQLLGVPQKRINVPSVLDGDKVELQSLDDRYELQDRLLADRTALEAKLKEAEAKLIEMGAKYEEERNRSIFRRILTWSLGTLGVGGIVALFVFFPFLIPVVTRFGAWLAAKIPGLVGALGVVPKQAFDAVVIGIEKAKADLGEQGSNSLNSQLSMSMDAAHKQLVRARKPVNPLQK